MKMQSNIYAPIAGPHRENTCDLRPTRRSQRSPGDDRTVSSGQLRKTRTIPLALPPQPARPYRLHSARIRRTDRPPFSRSVSSRRPKTFSMVPLRSFPGRIGMLARQRTIAFSPAPSLRSSLSACTTPRRAFANTHPRTFPSSAAGRADRYAKFLIEEVKPFVDREYRTLFRFATHRHRRFPHSADSFLSTSVSSIRASSGRLAALSPSVWWKPTSDSPLCARVGDRTPPVHLAGHWHARRPAHRPASRKIPRRAPRKRLEARKRFTLRKG